MMCIKMYYVHVSKQVQSHSWAYSIVPIPDAEGPCVSWSGNAAKGAMAKATPAMRMKPFSPTSQMLVSEAIAANGAIGRYERGSWPHY